jgi:myo-inositol 2-dehydrogenase/D-chiro-inositol 1-dehydrogenase
MSATTRRRFLKTSAATTLAVAANAHVQGQQGNNNQLKVGLVGCGGRGTGAATQALQADSNVKLWAMADAFEDRLQQSLTTLRNNRMVAENVDVPAERRHVGFDAYRRVIESCDVVLLCTPPGFRPIHLRAAVEANKHIFAEKPVAVDAPGVRSVLATCEEARRRNLSVVSGLCLRYDNGYKDIVGRIQNGAIGDPMTLHAIDLRGAIWSRPREAGWTDMQWQMRDWYYFTWLSGDFNVEQHVHNLDVCAWVMGNRYPVRCYGAGGRQVRTAPEFGHIYDHFNVTYEYENGAKIMSQTRQQAGCRNDIVVQVQGTSGSASLTDGRRRGQSIRTAAGERTYDGPVNQMYQTEHDELFASIRMGRPINNGEYMARSTLLAILGRMAAYTGQMITWEQALNSREDLSPPRYDWDVPLPVPPVAMPGQTRFS